MSETRKAISCDGKKVGGVVVEDSDLSITRLTYSYRLELPGRVTLHESYAATSLGGVATLLIPKQIGLFAGRIHPNPEPFVLTATHCDGQTETHGWSDVTLYFDTDERAFHEFEVSRIGRSTSPVTIMLELRGNIRIQDGRRRPYHCNLPVVIQVSQWTELLKQAGYSLSFLHRFPSIFLARHVGDRYRASVESFRLAEILLMQSHPTKAVEECRNALHLLARAACGGVEFEENAMKKLLSSIADGEKRTRFLRMWKSLMVVANDPHHPRVDEGSYKRIEYDTDEARYILTMTATTIEFIGDLIIRKEG